MPDLAVHYYFGQSVLSELPPALPVDKGIFDFALSGPDDWFYCFRNKEKWARASYMHNHSSGAFLCALASEPVLFSYFCGFLCHYILDATCHPYIIARTGSYTRTAETKQFLGNHTAFERALDRWILRNEAGRHPLTDTMMGSPLPAETEQPLNRVYSSVYHWDHIFPDLLKAKQNMRFYLRFLEGPSGLAKTVTGVIPHPFLKPLPYSRNYYADVDILNLSHKEWHHPKDPDLKYTCSFPELMEDAKIQAVKTITAVSHNDLSMIGNRSYLTGFDLDDDRNSRKEITDQILPR